MTARKARLERFRGDERLQIFISLGVIVANLGRGDVGRVCV